MQRGKLLHRFVNSPYSPAPQINNRAILTATQDLALITTIHPDARSFDKIRLRRADKLKKRMIKVTSTVYKGTSVQFLS